VLVGHVRDAIPGIDSVLLRLGHVSHTRRVSGLTDTGRAHAQRDSGRESSVRHVDCRHAGGANPLRVPPMVMMRLRVTWLARVMAVMPCVLLRRRCGCAGRGGGDVRGSRTGRRAARDDRRRGQNRHAAEEQAGNHPGHHPHYRRPKAAGQSPNKATSASGCPCAPRGTVARPRPKPAGVPAILDPSATSLATAPHRSVCPGFDTPFVLSPSAGLTLQRLRQLEPRHTRLRPGR
jgi:hypothetical protein